MFSYDLQQSFMAELTKSIGVKINSAYLWAKKNYVHGIPKASLINKLSGEGEVLNTLNTLHGPGISAEYYVFGPLNTSHFAWKKLFDDYGYDPVTNTLASLTATKGSTVYLTDMVAIYPASTVDFCIEQDEMEQLDVLGPLANSGISLDYPSGNPSAVETPYEVDLTSNTLNRVRIHYQYMSGGVITNETLLLTLPSNEEDDHHQVRYTDGSGVVRYFTYRDGAGTYPAIDAVFDLTQNEEVLGTYMPWVYLRWDFQNEGRTEVQNTENYRDAVALCRRYTVDYDTLINATHEDQEVDDVIQSILLFGVDSQAKNMVEKEYLFRYFDSMFTIQSGNSGDGMIGSTGGGSSYSQVIRDKRYKMSFSYAGIRRTTHTGSVAAVGKYTSSNSSSAGVYRKQIDPTTYVEVVVYNPSLRNHILGGYGHTAFLGQKELRIPIDMAIVKQMSLVKREELLSRAMYLNINTYIETESKWYQSGWFRIVMIIIAIIITIFTWGAAWPALGAALAAGAVATIILLATWALYAVLIQVAIKLFIDVAGLENSAIAAVLMIAASFFIPGGMANGPAISNALLQAGNNMIQQVGKGYGEELKQIQEEIEDFSSYAKTEQEKLEERQEAYWKETNFVNALDFVTMAPAIISGESPQDLYERTVHSGNPGRHLYSWVNEYATQNLALPTFKQTIGEIDNGLA